MNWSTVIPASAMMRRRVPARICLWSGNNDSGVRLGPTQHHVTTALATKYETNPFQGRPHVSTRKVRRQFGHELRSSPLGCFDIDEFSADLGRNRISCFTAILDVQLNCLADVGERFSAVVALTDASRKRWDDRDVAAVLFLFQDDCVAHSPFPSVVSYYYLKLEFIGIRM